MLRPRLDPEKALASSWSGLGLEQSVLEFIPGEDSPVEVQLAVRWVGEDLLCVVFVEQVSFKSGMEERVSDGWYDGGDRW